MLLSSRAGAPLQNHVVPAFDLGTLTGFDLAALVSGQSVRSAAEIMQRGVVVCTDTYFVPPPFRVLEFSNLQTSVELSQSTIAALSPSWSHDVELVYVMAYLIGAPATVGVDGAPDLVIELSLSSPFKKGGNSSEHATNAVY